MPIHSVSQSVRVLQTIASTRLDHGGTSRSVPALCNALTAANLDCHLVTGVPADVTISCNFPDDLARVHTARESKYFRQLGVGRTFCRYLADLTKGRSGDCLVHDHAVWLPTNHAVARFCRKRAIKRVISPRGMLGDWALSQGRWKKRLAWWTYQRNDLRTADAFHATSQLEADEIRKLGLKQPIAVIPNGITFRDEQIKRDADYRGDGGTVLFLSRIHPKKGLLTLLHAWKLAQVPKSWRLVLAGPDENGHQQDVEQLAHSLGIGFQVSFPGSISDEEKWDYYRNADLFVLPSYSENFGIVVAEALVAGLPVIATHGTPWHELTTKNAGWHVPHDISSLSTALKQAISMESSRRQEMGLRGHAWAKSAFGWDGVGKRMAVFYRSLLLPGVVSSPDVV